MRMIYEDVMGDDEELRRLLTFSQIETDMYRYRRKNKNTPKPDTSSRHVLKPDTTTGHYTNYVQDLLKADWKCATCGKVKKSDFSKAFELVLMCQNMFSEEPLIMNSVKKMSETLCAVDTEGAHKL